MIEQCNFVPMHKKHGGRRRRWVTDDDLIKTENHPPTETMLRLAQLKNEGHSWRSLANEVNHFLPPDIRPIGHSHLRRVALGYCKSTKVDYALGIRQKPPPIPVEPCPECGQVHKQRKACKPSRKTGKHSFVILLDDDDFYEACAAVAGYPGGRPAWLMERVRGVESARG